MEATFPRPVVYDGNLRVGASGRWFVDTEHECLTDDPSPRSAELRGGICADVPGAGKTAAAIRLVLEDLEAARRDRPRGGYATAATLVIVPLNLTSQWLGEIDRQRGVRVLPLLAARDLRAVDMRALCDDYDVVLTTFYFLRSCRAYGDLIDSALGGRPRTRASLSSWARLPGHGQPVLEAIRWRRVVVDEIHQTFESARDTRALLSSTWAPGAHGHPALDTEHAQHLYALPRARKRAPVQPARRVTASAVRNHADARVGAGSTHASSACS